MATQYNEEASKELITKAKNGAHPIPASLLEKGADPNYRDEKGFSAMDYATTGMKSDGKLFNGGTNSLSEANMDLLIKAGVDPYQIGGTGLSPVENLILEAKHANEYHGADQVAYNAITKGKEEPFGDFVKKVRSFTNKQENNHDA